MPSVWDAFIQKTEQVNKEIIKNFAEASDELAVDIVGWKKSWLEKIEKLQEQFDSEKDASKENDINSSNQFDSIQIKQEKISMDPLVVVKIENDRMPPPSTGTVKKTRKKATSTCSTRSSSRKTGKAETQIEFGDIMIEEVNVPYISLCDSDEPVKSTRTTRVTRSKAKTDSTTRKTSIKMAEVNEHIKKKKKSESNKNEENMDGTFVVQEEKQLNETFGTNKKEDKKIEKEKDDNLLTDDESEFWCDETRINEKSVQEENKTYVAEKPSIKSRTPDSIKTVIAEKPTEFINEKLIKTPELNIEQIQDNELDMNDLLTDDESFEKRLIPVRTKTKMPIFSTYAASPMKQKIEAFEKLEAQSKTDLPPRQTRTKTKADAKKQMQQEEPLILPSTSNVKQKLKLTPISANKFLHPQIPSLLLHTKEKTSEASRKRQALLLAQSEEKKRNREEKQLKAQQLREAKIKEKQKMLEMNEKLKEERARMMVKEKQERLQKQKEETDQRRLLAAKRAQEERKRQEKEKNKPIYITTAMPLLPTFDCYDSDIEEEEKETTHVQPPAWEKSASFMELLTSLENSSSRILQTLFCLKAQTPDLRSIFQNISERKLKRNSSAIWKQKPCYSILPTSLCEEFHSFTDDEDL